MLTAYEQDTAVLKTAQENIARLEDALAEINEINLTYEA